MTSVPLRVRRRVRVTQSSCFKRGQESHKGSTQLNEAKLGEDGTLLRAFLLLR